MSPEAEIAARFRAHIERELPQVKARVRVRYLRGFPYIEVTLDATGQVDAVCELATIYADDLFSISVNSRWICPDDEDDHEHLYDDE